MDRGNRALRKRSIEDNGREGGFNPVIVVEPKIWWERVISEPGI